MPDAPDRLHIDIAPDPDPIDPRAQYDHFGRMVCWHDRYDLGDKHDWPTPGDFRAAMPDAAILKLPIFAYDHSGLTISTEPFHCPWDSGQVGWIFQEKTEILREFSRKRLSEKLRSQVFSILRAEVAEYDAYVRGDVWTVTICDTAGEVSDSVSGIIGHDVAVGEARAMFDDVL